MIFSEDKQSQGSFINAIKIFQEQYGNGRRADIDDLKKNPFLALVVLVNELEEAEKQSLQVNDLLLFHHRFEECFDVLLSGKAKHGFRCLRAGLYLLKSWLYAKIQDFDSESLVEPFATLGKKSQKDSEYYFDKALSEEQYYLENKLHIPFESDRVADPTYDVPLVEAPVTNGLVHHLHAQRLWVKATSDSMMSREKLSEINDAMEAAAKLGFNYKEYAFSQPIVSSLDAIIHKKDTPGMDNKQVSLSQFSIKDCFEDTFIYSRQQQRREFPLLESRSIRLIGYIHMVRFLQLGDIKTALHIIKGIVDTGELSYLCEINDDDSDEIKSIKSFWSHLLASNYPTLRNIMFDVVIAYNRYDDNKQARQQLRDRILDHLINIDGLGTTRQDSGKMQLIKRDILPLITELSGTGLSAAQKAGIRSKKDGAIKKSLSKLVMNLLEPLVSIAGITAKDIERLMPSIAQSSDTNFSAKDAELGVKQYIRIIEQKNQKRTSQWKVWTDYQAIVTQNLGKEQFSHAHNLLPVAMLEKAIAENRQHQDMEKFAGAVERIEKHLIHVESSNNDPLLSLYILTRKFDPKQQQTVFQELTENAKLNDDGSLWDFTHDLQLKTCADSTLRAASASYLIGLALCSKEYYSLGSYYLAKAHHHSRGGTIFQNVDFGYLSQLFHRHNWQLFYEDYSKCIQGYLSKYEKDTGVHEERVSFIEKLQDHLSHIQTPNLSTDLTISLSQDDNKKNSQKISEFYQEHLWQLLYLSGISLGKLQRTAMKAGAMSRNLCSVTSDGITLAIQCLGMNKKQFMDALDQAKTEASKSNIDMRLSFEACEKYFDSRLEETKKQLKADKHGLMSECLHDLAINLEQVNAKYDGHALSAVQSSQNINSKDALSALLNGIPIINELKFDSVSSPRPTQGL